MLNQEQQKELLNIAHETVASLVKTGRPPEFKITDAALNKKQGAFVTLTKNGKLRGCIGLIESSGEPLWRVVRDMAAAAASQDWRFSPITEAELDDLAYEISVLSAPEKIDDWRKIKLGEHGVIISKGNSCGVFLPQVAEETGWTLEEFLRELCVEKAGLAYDAFKDKDTAIQVFTVQVIK